MRKIPYLHLVLFVLTFFSTLLAYAVFQRGTNVLREPMRIFEGLPFSLTLMTILLGHELSHYLASKKHHTKATLPYFIPAPITLIGTFGAFIKMKSPIITRRALVDIGASGPIAGFVLSVAAALVGLSFSSVVPMGEAKGALELGDSLVFSFLAHAIFGRLPESYQILLHPVAFAGWIGLFVTSLNLIPIGQLDGGHIAYAFLGEGHRFVSITLVVVLLLLGLAFWEGWAFWGVAMLVLGLNHPPVIHWEVPLDATRRITGVFALFIFIVTFMPWPFRFL